MDDAELVDGLLRGEARYQLALLDRYQDRLSEYLFRFHPLVAIDAEDIAVEVLEQLVFNPSIINLSKGHGSLNGLVFKMAKNRAIDQVRKTKRSLRGSRVVSLDEHSATLDRVADDDARVVDGRLGSARDETASTLPPKLLAETKQMLAGLELSEGDSEHLRLRIEEKLKPKEIAKFLGITKNNERVRWFRLKAKFEKEWRNYPQIVKYGKEIGALDPGTKNQDVGSKARSD